MGRPHPLQQKALVAELIAHILDAAGLTKAAAGDLQLAVPPYPCVSPGVLTAWLRDGFVIEGSHSRRVLRGSSTRGLLTEILPLLDGTRSWDEIADAAEVDVQSLHEVLMILFAAGLLVDGEPGDSKDLILKFFHRVSDETRANASGVQARKKLSGSRVRLIGDLASMTSLEEHLSAVGIEVAAGEISDNMHFDLAIALITKQSRKQSLEEARTLRRSGVPVLPIYIEESAMVVGPVSYSDFGPCIECGVQQVQLAANAEADSLSELIGSMVAQEAILMISQTGSAQAMNNAIRVSLRPLSTEPLTSHARPGCLDCGGGGPLIEEPPLAYKFETAVAMLPARLRRPRGHQKHYEPANIALQYAERVVSGQGTVGLTYFSSTESQTNNGLLDLSAVSRLLQFSFGMNRARSQAVSQIRRWTPTGGNLGSPQAYVSLRGVHGIEDGAYFYGSQQHEIVKIGPPPLSAPSGASISIVCEIGRIFKKYNNFGYRIVHLDAGGALASIRVVAAASGLRVTNSDAWDDRAIQQTFELSETEQIVAAHVHVGGRLDA